MTSAPPDFSELSPLAAAVQDAPRAPGVYLMKDRDGVVLYVGKAVDLKARLRSYAGRTDGRAMIPFLLSRVAAVEVIVTATEKEALILENTLIKRHRPRYNVLFRDDKSYVLIRMDLNDPFPRFTLVRRPGRDGARTFGPYPSGGAARETLRFLQSVFPLRTCRDADFRGRKRPCLEYQIGRCLGPCVGRIPPEDYRRLCQDSVAFLEGRTTALLTELEARMAEASRNLAFEEAAQLRDRIAAIQITLEKQKVAALGDKDADVFGLWREGDVTMVTCLAVREGQLIGQDRLPPIRLAGETEAILAEALQRLYDGGRPVPREILLPLTIPDAPLLADWLSDLRGRKVALSVPQRGQGADLVRMACANAETAFKMRRPAEVTPEETAARMARLLGLSRPPRRIECFDISNLGEAHAVGSLAALADGEPDKARYRRYRIRTAQGPDDYGMMREVLSRRCAGPDPLPELIVVDGGKGQLAVAMAVLKDLGRWGEADVIALAKADGPDLPGLPAGQDRVFVPGRKNPILLHKHPDVLHVLQRVRDEAHRFGVSYLHRVKEKADFASPLDAVPGIGPARKKALLAAFGSVTAVRRASAEDLARTLGLGRDAAEALAVKLRGLPREGEEQ